MTAGGYSELAYERLVADIFSRRPSFASAGAAAYKPGLERMRELCDVMGNPQHACPCVHVAGTNGKGSTCNMLAAHFAARGLKVGLYTSPHILDFRERIRVVGDMGHGGLGAALIPREAVWEFMTRHDADIERLELSFFEITTAMAFWYFARVGVDMAVIETGLGGRLDATNVVCPELSVITNIGFDHTDLLGSTLSLVAGEKAGIIKAGVPVVVGERGAQSDPVFEAVAARLTSPLTFAEDLADGGLPHGVDVSAVLAKMDLRGSYQAKNLVTVLAALKVLGQTPDVEALEHAAAICGFHGRWEKISDNPLTICDIGHNEHGLRHNFAQLESMLEDMGGDGGAEGGFSDLVMVYGSVADKDVEAVVRLWPRRSRVFICAADNHRAMPAEDIADIARRVFGGDSAGPGRPGSEPARPGFSVCGSVAAAVEQALSYCKECRRPLLYIGGSTYVVGEALRAPGICR